MTTPVKGAHMTSSRVKKPQAVEKKLVSLLRIISHPILGIRVPVVFKKQNKSGGIRAMTRHLQRLHRDFGRSINPKPNFAKESAWSYLN